MGRYSALTDEQLAEKTQKFVDALEELALGGEVAVIVTDGRRMEIVAGNETAAENILKQLEDERARRDNGGVLPGCAINVRILRP